VRGFYFEGGYRPGTLIDGGEYLATMPERDAKFLEVFVCQIAEYGNVNFILSKALSVLTEAELLKPVRDLLHRSPNQIYCASSLQDQR
jgi:hypothetical protein